MYEAARSRTDDAKSQLQLFFSTAGQGPTQDFAWQSEDGLPVPEILDEIGEKYIDDREISWAAQRTETGELLLVVRQLPSRITDPGLRRHRNAFALRMSEQDEDLMRAIMIELLQNSEAFAGRVDELVSIDSENVKYGWKFRFEDFRTLLAGIREQAQINYAENDGEKSSYLFSSLDSRLQLISKLVAMCLPKGKWIAICNPIVTDAILEMPVWALVTDTSVVPKSKFVPKTEPRSHDAPFSNISSDEAALVVIAAAALIVFWLLIRRK
jgi:hypothetical protein